MMRSPLSQSGVVGGLRPGFEHTATSREDRGAWATAVGRANGILRWASASIRSALAFLDYAECLRVLACTSASQACGSRPRRRSMIGSRSNIQGYRQLRRRWRHNIRGLAGGLSESVPLQQLSLTARTCLRVPSLYRSPLLSTIPLWYIAALHARRPPSSRAHHGRGQLENRLFLPPRVP